MGLTCHCTLTERVGRRGVVTDYFVVQVKSDTDPWDIPWRVLSESGWWNTRSLCFWHASIKNGVLCIYHVTPRFLVGGTMGELPGRLELRPGGH